MTLSIKKRSEIIIFHNAMLINYILYTSGDYVMPDKEMVEASLATVEPYRLQHAVKTPRASAKRGAQDVVANSYGAEEDTQKGGKRILRVKAETQSWNSRASDQKFLANCDDGLIDEKEIALLFNEEKNYSIESIEAAMARSSLAPSQNPDIWGRAGEASARGCKAETPADRIAKHKFSSISPGV
jgi:hypothetical protein